MPKVSEPPPAAPKVSAQAVKRILEKQMEYLGELDDYSFIRWDKMPDGTNVGIFEEDETAVRYAWTVDPNEFEAKRLRPVDE